MAKNNKDNYIRTDKVYDIMGLGNTNLVGWKRTGSNSLHKDKNSYHITMRTKPFVFKISSLLDFDFCISKFCLAISK